MNNEQFNFNEIKPEQNEQTNNFRPQANRGHT